MSFARLLPIPCANSRRAAALLAACTALLGLLAVAGFAGEPAPADKEVAGKLRISVQEFRHLRSQSGLSNAALLELPSWRLSSLLRQTEMMESPAQRAAFDALLHQDEKGTIAPEAAIRAMRQLEQLRQKVVPEARVAEVFTGPRVKASALFPSVDMISAEHHGWVALGPDAGGRTRAIVVHPRNTDVLFAGSAGGGVWKSVNGGKEWSPASTDLANLAVSCLVLDPNNPETLYAGTGEGFYMPEQFEDVGRHFAEPRGSGIYRSTNGGNTWERLPATASFPYVNRLALSADSKVLLAAVRSPDRPEENGIYRSADPQRSHWERCPLDADIADIKFHPSDPAKAIAGTVGGSPRSMGKAYYSRDGGQTWKEAALPDIASMLTTNLSGRVELVYAAQNPSIVYASVDAAPKPQWRNRDLGQLWRSNDGGRSYTQQKCHLGQQEPVPFLSGQGWYANALWAGDPTNADFVIVGGTDLWKSTDGGQTLMQISDWRRSPLSPHADHHAIVAHSAYDGKRNKAVYFGNDGGIYKSEDISKAGADSFGMSGWSALNNHYGPIQLYGAAGNPRTGTLIAGSQDNGTFRLDPKGKRMEVSKLFGGDGGFCAADPEDPKVLYGEYVQLLLFRSGPNGAEEISGVYQENRQWTAKPAPYYIPDVMESFSRSRHSAALFIAPFILDPNDRNRMLAGGAQLWRSNDVRAPLTRTTGPKWASIKKPLPDVQVLDAWELISAIAVASGHPEVIWVGHMHGSVFRTSNGTSEQPQWVRVGAGSNSLPRRYCTRIVIDPSNPHQVYTTFGGYRNDNVYRTTDDGKTWTCLGAGSLPETPVHTLAIHPQKPDYLYLGTDVGVFMSQDGGTRWTPVNEGPTNCPVRELFWMGQTLVAATYGRGLFQIDLTLPSR